MFQTGRKRAGKFVRTAWTTVSEAAALVDTGSPRKTSAVGQGVGNLPTAQDEVHRAAAVTHIFFASANGQFVNGVGHKHLIAIVLVWPPGKPLVYGEIIIIVCESMGERVVRDELQTGADALFGFHLQSIVFVIGVVTVIAGIHRAASRCR